MWLLPFDCCGMIIAIFLFLLPTRGFGFLCFAGQTKLCSCFSSASLPYHSLPSFPQQQPGRNRLTCKATHSGLTQQQHQHQQHHQQHQFDPEYYTPLDQTSRPEHSQSRITLTRFLSNAVKDNPDVRRGYFFFSG